MSEHCACIHAHMHICTQITLWIIYASHHWAWPVTAACLPGLRHVEPGTGVDSLVWNMRTKWTWESLGGWVGSFCTSMSHTSGLLHCCYGCTAQRGDRGEGRLIVVHSEARDEVVHSCFFFGIFLSFFFFLCIFSKDLIHMWRLSKHISGSFINLKKSRILCHYLCVSMQLYPCLLIVPVITLGLSAVCLT